MTNTTSTPTIDRTDPRPQFAAAIETLRSVVHGIGPDRLGLPTPCPDMNVRELIDHVGMAVGRVTAAGRRLPLDQWPTDGFSVGDDVTAGIDRLSAEALAAWTDERLAEPVQLPWTTLSGADALATYVNEMLVHTWDLATATEQTPDFDPAAIAVAEAIMHQELPAPERGPMWEEFARQMPEGIPFAQPFADAVAVADDAPAIVRLVAWNGRRP
ncbi:TIGR03086 family metal-binding protein [Actinospongicola halichondriae]|uniref:TIGR03086 family metal-binding protein n=1 Tax=Actinospongicola halichondriae TaxID=3236844 RepID=UPI003D55BF2C